MTPVPGGDAGQAVLAARHIPLLIDGAAASDSRHREERND
jgi:hypothetical protein